MRGARPAPSPEASQYDFVPLHVDDRVDRLRFCGNGDVRVRVVIPSTDRRLASWPRYVRKYAPDDRRKNFRNTLREVPGAEAAVPRFWIYFGVIPVERIKAVERVESDEQAPARK
jgi:hypothetical protein